MAMLHMQTDRHSAICYDKENTVVMTQSMFGLHSLIVIYEHLRSYEYFKIFLLFISSPLTSSAGPASQQFYSSVRWN